MLPDYRYCVCFVCCRQSDKIMMPVTPEAMPVAAYKPAVMANEMDHERTCDMTYHKVDA